MALPNTKVEIAFDSGYTTPAASRTWTDVSAYVEGAQPITISRGRSDEVSQVQPSRLSLTLNNKDGRFTPRLSTGAYYPNVKKGRPIRVTATYNAVDYVRYTGYVSEWPVSWPDSSSAVCVVNLTSASRMARLGRGAELRSIVEEEILTNSPAWYYTLGGPDGSTSDVDSSGNQAPMLTVTGGGTTDPAFGTTAWEAPVGAGTTGVQFTATTGRYLHAPTTQTFGAGTGSASFVCLFRSTTTTSAALIRGGGDFNSNLVGIQTGATGYLRTDLGGGINSSPTSANDGLDHTAVVTDDGTTTKLYLDGALVGSGASTGWALTAITIGGAPNNSPNVLGGVTIGHAAGFTAALTATQVLSVHQALTTGFAGESAGAWIERLAAYGKVPAAEVSADVGSSTIRL